MSRPFYFWSAVLAPFAAAVLQFLALMRGAPSRGRGSPDGLGIFLLVTAAAAQIYLVVVMCVLCYKMWRILPPGWGRTRPTNAVGYMFVPLFNIYWMYEVLWGWTKDYNRSAHKRHLEVPEAPEGLSLAVCICLTAYAVLAMLGLAGVPLALLLGGLVALALPVLTAILVYRICTALNAVSPVLGRSFPAITLGVEALALGVCSIAIPFQGILLGILAIFQARAQQRAHRCGLAVIGRVLGTIGICVWVVTIVGVAVWYTR